MTILSFSSAPAKLPDAMDGWLKSKQMWFRDPVCPVKIMMILIRILCDLERKIHNAKDSALAV
jgi:hypothetical protein